MSQARADNFKELDDYNFVGIGFLVDTNINVHEIQYFSVSDAITSFGGFYKSWTLFMTLLVTPIILGQMKTHYAKQIQ